MNMIDEEIYVRKDLYDAHMKSIESLLSANLSRHQALAEHIGGELKAMNTRIDGLENTMSARIDAINTRIDDLKDSQSHNLAYWGIAVALFVGAVQVVVSLVLNFWKF